eukprot:gene12612-14802_t
MYSWGSGRIGHGKLSDTLKPTLLSFPWNSNVAETGAGTIPTGNPNDFISICAGRSHSLAVDVWMFGDGAQGQGGDGQLEIVSTPQTIQSINTYDDIPPGSPEPGESYPKIKITNVACWDISFAITDKGRVFSWGPYDLCGAVLGDQPSAYVHYPVEIRFSRQIESISCSLHHCVAVAKDGTCYSWGSAYAGRLGLPLPAEVYGQKDYRVQEPRQIESFSRDSIKIASSACGEYHTLFLDRNGDVHSTGFGWATGYDIDDPDCDFITLPKKIESLSFK